MSEMVHYGVTVTSLRKIPLEVASASLRNIPLMLSGKQCMQQAVVLCLYKAFALLRFQISQRVILFDSLELAFD